MGQQHNPSVDDQAQAILDDLEHLSYEAVASKYGTSRGKVYSLAVKHRRRKNEARIGERRRERKRRQMEFVQEVMNATLNADVLDYLDGLPDGSVNLHATSIPYNVGKSYGGHELVDRQRHHFWLGWTLQVLSEMARTLAEGGVLFLQVGQTKLDDGSLYPIDVLLFEHLRQMGLTYQNRVVWEIPHGLTPKNRLAERCETALIFSKGPVPAHLNVNAARVPQKQPDKRAFKGPNKGKLSGHPLGAWPTNVWRIPAVGANHGEKTGHCAQFPEALVRRAILLYTVPGELVVDVFSGSGTTQAQAVATGRAFSGCDLFYEDVRAQRLAGVAPDIVSMLPGVTDESVAVWQAEAQPVEHKARRMARDEAEQMALELFGFDLFDADSAAA